MYSQTDRTRISNAAGWKENHLPYVDINPHKIRPKWPAYVGLAVLLIATIAVVTHVLSNH